jgi:NADH dehydrogenase [ubiquinone] 1 alpha subcomplex assembly factor 1
MTILAILVMTITLNSKILFDFSENKDTGNWLVVNDGVMGGLSKGNFVSSENETAVFREPFRLKITGAFLRFDTTPAKLMWQVFPFWNCT